MSPLDLVRDAILLVTLVLAVVTDLRTRRIYDWITLPAIALGFLVAFLAGGVGDGWTDGLRGAFVGFSVCFGIFVVLVVTGGMGGGDAKLMGAVGALLGWPASGGALVFVTIAGGIQGVCALLVRTGIGRRLAARAGVTGTDAPEFARHVPYGVAIGAGTVAFRIWLLVP